MGAQDRNLKKWLYGNLTASRKHGRFEKVQIRHVQRGNKIGDEIIFHEVPENADESWCDDIAREILEGLNAEAENLGGVQKFACYAYYDKLPDPVNRHVVRMASETPNGEEKSLDSETPDSTGLTSQAMRHTEAFARIATAGSTAQINTLLKMLDKQAAMVDSLMNDKLENMKIVNELLDKRLEREIQFKKEETKEKALQAGIDSAKLLAPVIANKILGKKILPEPTNALAILGKQFFTSIANKPDKMAAIIGALDRNEQITMMELIESFEANAEEKATPKD